MRQITAILLRIRTDITWHMSRSPTGVAVLRGNVIGRTLTQRRTVCELAESDFETGNLRFFFARSGGITTSDITLGI